MIEGCVRWKLAFTAILFLGYWFIAARGPRAVGLWQDDAIYLCTAKSLAAGLGYRHIEVPGQPLQTKYPILYPALLALGFKLGPDYPRCLVGQLALGALAAAGLAMLGMGYWQRVLGADRWLTLLAGTPVVLSPVIISFVRFTMSDLPYGVLALAAVYIMDAKYEQATTARQGWGWLALAALLAALGMLTRSIGITLAVALVGLLLARKRWRHAGMAAAILVVFLAPWYVRQWLALRANGPLQSAFLIAPDVDYALWLPRTPADTVRVIGQNFLRTAFGLTYFHWAWPRQWVMDAIATVTWRTAALHVASYMSVLLILLGFASSLRPRMRLLHVYAVAYAALMLAWPFEPYRFLIPWTPFLIYFLLRGVRIAAGWVTRGRAALVPAAVISTVLLVLFVADDVRIVRSTERSYYLREFPIDWSEVRAVEDWVARNTQRHEVLASAFAAGLYLATGRSGYYFWPDSNPYRLFYGPDRAARTFCLLESPSEAEYVRAELRNLPEVYAAADIRYYIEQRQIDVGAGAMAEYVRRHPELLAPVFVTHGGNFTVYKTR